VERGKVQTVTRRALAASAALIAIAAMSVTAEARDAEQSTGAETAAPSDDIVVTARRRDESLQAVPLAVSAIQPQMLKNSGVDSVGDLPLVAPALTMAPSPGGGRSSPNFSIRGLSQQELSILADQSVSTYIGDAVIARVQGVNGALYDIGSIEVLRGPQGTLFGRNTTGGAVVIRPNKPVDHLEGMAAITVGSFGTFNTEGMINLPLGDAASLRVAGRTLHDNGYVYDELLGRNINDTDQQAFRVSLKANLSPRFETLTTYEYFRENDGAVGAYIDAVNPAASNNAADFRAARGYRPLETLLAEQQERGIYRIANGTPGFTKVQTHLATNTMTYELSDSIAIKNIFSYRHVKDNLRDDLDGTESSIFPQQRIDRSWQWSEEFQVIGSSARFNWIAGLYYFKERGRLQALSNANTVDPGAIEYRTVEEYPDLYFSYGDISGRNISYAAYAQGTYELLDKLRLTVGGRMNWDRRRSIIRNQFPRVGCRFTTDGDNDPSTPETTPPLSECEFKGNAKFSEPTYNLSLDYQFGHNRLVYIAHRHGYRSGGFGSRATSAEGLARTYAPETVDDFEIGLKADWHLGDTFLRTNLAAYNADYKDIQRVLTDATIIPVQSVTVNAGSARIRGIEAEILFRPVPWIDLTANYAYTDAKYKTFITPTGVDLSDTPLARAPKNVYTLGLRYDCRFHPTLAISPSTAHTIITAPTMPTTPMLRA
jgi:iron complex outermembrane receptor protein